MATQTIKRVTFEDVAILKYALNFELDIMREKSDVKVALLVGLNGQVLASSVPNDLNSDLYRLLSMVRANIPYLRREMTLGRIEQSITRYATGNVVVSGVGVGELLISIFDKEAPIPDNLNQIGISSQILYHISKQKGITEEVLEEYGKDISNELKELTHRLYAELESAGTIGEKKKNEGIIEKFTQVLNSVIGEAESAMVMNEGLNQMALDIRHVSGDEWRALAALIRSSVESTAGQYYAEQVYKQLVEIITKSEELF